MATFDGFGYFLYNFVKREANFIILFMLLLEMICA